MKKLLRCTAFALSIVLLFLLFASCNTKDIETEQVPQKQNNSSSVYSNGSNAGNSEVANTQTVYQSKEQIEYYLLDGGNAYGVRIKTTTDTQKIDIPAVHNEKPVTEVYGFIFEGANWLQEVIIPEGITDITLYVYAECSNLTSLKLPHSISSITLWLFEKSHNLQTIYYVGSGIEWSRVDILYYSIYGWNYYKNYFNPPKLELVES